jgi:UrcA family protein
MTYDKLPTVVAAIAMVGSSIALASPAFAQNGKPVIVRAEPLTDVISIRRVGYRDLNLASADGEKMLNRRVRSAVSEVCYDATGPNPLLSLQQSCRADSWGRAKPQMDLAMQRARDIAANGYSTIAPVAIAIVAHR